MMKKKIVLFDIDHTLFNATIYKKRMMELIAECIPFKDRAKLYQVLEAQYFSHREKNGYFDLECLVREGLQELQIEADVAKIFSTVMDHEASFEESLFVETREVLESLAKQKDILIGVLSAGREDHQLRKIKNFQHVFAKEHINILKLKEQQLDTVMKKYQHETLFFIDDVLTILYKAKQLHKDITTIWMKRGRFAEDQKAIAGFTPDYIVYNLQEVLPILI